MRDIIAFYALLTVTVLWLLAVGWAVTYWVMRFMRAWRR